MYSYEVRRTLSKLSGKEGWHHDGGNKRITWGVAIVGSYRLFDDDYWSFDVDQMTYYVGHEEIKACPAGYCDVVHRTVLKDFKSEEDILTFMLMAEEKAMKMFR